VKAYTKFEMNFPCGNCPEKTKLQEHVQFGATTFFTADAVRVMETIKGKSERRSKLQSGLEQLQSFGASETSLDAILKSNLDKNMRV
jgi:hypothetical protein